MLFEELSAALPTYREYALVAMIILILIQLGIVGLLVLFTIGNRIREDTIMLIQKRKSATWYDLLFDYLDDGASIEDFKKLVPPRSFPFFTEFIKEFFLDLDGDEKDKLRLLMIELGLDRYMAKQLKHRNYWKRMYAVYFLGLMDCHTAIPELRKHIRDSSDLVSIMTISNLMQLKDLDSLPEIIAHLSDTRLVENKHQITLIFTEFGPEILPHLEKLFRQRHLDDWIQEVFIDIFGHYVYLEVTDAILAVFETSSNLELRIRCVETLSNFEDPSLIEFFETLLIDSEPPIMIHAIKALGKLGADSSIPRLSQLAESSHFWVAKRSIESLNEMGEEGMAVLSNLIQASPSSVTRSLIQETLVN